MTQDTATQIPEKPSARRGRPRRGSEGSRRREILSAAENLFLEQGFGAVSVDAIAKQAQVSKKTIYCLFDTKEELFDAIMRAHMEESHLPELPEAVATLADFESALATYLTELAEAILGPVAVGLFRLSVSEAPRFPGLAQAFYREGALRHIVHLNAWLQRQHAAGIVTIEDPAEVGSMMTSFTVLEPLRAAALRVRELPTPAEITKRAQITAKIVARGCAKGI